jgi:hypothetical protein
MISWFSTVRRRRSPASRRLILLNGRYFTVANATGTTFELTEQDDGTDVDSSTMTAYASAGTADTVFELATPYAAADLATLKMVQKNDTITITHPNYDPRDLTRTAHATWSLDVIDFQPSVDDPTGISVTVNTAGTATVRYKVTAVDNETGEESLAGLNTTSETITGATAANPVVLTITGHPYVDFDEIEVNSIVGMTELNGRRFRVNSTGANTVELIGEDGTNHTAYSSGGTANRTFVEITTSGATPDNTIAWTAVAGAERYAVYRNDQGSAQGAYGFLGEVDVVSVLDLNGGAENSPDTTQYSRTGFRTNMSKSTPSQADDAITATLNSRQVNEIRDFYPGNDLLVFTNSGEWRVNSGGQNAFEAATLRQKPQSEWGISEFHRPLAFGDTVMFVEENNARIRSLGYVLQKDGYAGSDMNLLAPHLLADRAPSLHTVKDWCSTKFPEGRLFIVRTDGQMLTMTFNAEQEVIAWTTFDTAGQFEACTSLRKSVSSVEDGVYVIVKRKLGTKTVRHIERFHTRKFATSSGAHFLDDGAVHDDGTPIDDITFGSIVLTIPGHSFTAGQSVYLADVIWQCDDADGGTELNDTFLNDTIYVVESVTTDTVTLSTLTDEVTNVDVEPELARNVTDITWNDDGTEAYVLGDTGGATQPMESHQYTCSTAYDFTTKAASSGSFQFSNSSSAWTSRMLWDDKGYRAVQWEMRTGPNAAS